MYSLAISLSYAASCCAEISPGAGALSKSFGSTSNQRVAEKKEGRTLGAGVVSAYIHTSGALGAIVELRAETDFVAKNDDFGLLADDLAMQITAASPTTVAELLDQPFIKEPNQTIGELVAANIQKFGERVEISRFARFDAHLPAGRRGGV